MGLITWLDFVFFLPVLFMFGYVFLLNTITTLHKVYLIFHFLLMLWPLCQFAVQTTDIPQFQFFYITVGFVGLSLIGAGLTVFAVFLTGQSYLLNRKTIFFISLPAIISALGVIINPAGMFARTVNGSYVEREYGPLFWFMCAALLFYFAVSTQHLAKSFRSDVSPRHKKLIKIVFAGLLVFMLFALADLFVNVVFAPLLPIIPGFISCGAACSCFFFVLAIQRFKVFNIIETAHQDVIDSMNTGIVVLDRYDNVIEINRVIRPFLDIRVGDRLVMEEFLAPLQIEGDLDAFVASYRKQPPERSQIEAALNNHKFSHVAIYSSPIFDQHMELIGRVVTFQDVSELRRLVDASHRQNEVLQDRNRALIMMQDELFRANQKLEQMAITDSLTGCFNRRYLMQQLEHEVMSNVRYNIPFAIFLFDIDLFKSINDTYGHLVGDEVIRSTAEVVKNSLRRTDIIARYGGEEFTVYLPHTNRSQAEMLAERIKLAVEENFITAGNDHVAITISMGVVTIEETGGTRIDNPKEYLRELFAMADAALYKAKDGGRNRIVNTKLA